LLIVSKRFTDGWKGLALTALLRLATNAADKIAIINEIPKNDITIVIK
jgi:hypothetical protein